MLLRNCISRWIYLLRFHIFKLNLKKIIYRHSLKCLASDKLKTTSFTNTERVYILQLFKVWSIGLDELTLALKGNT